MSMQAFPSAVTAFVTSGELMEFRHGNKIAWWSKEKIDSLPDEAKRWSDSFPNLLWNKEMGR